MSTQRSTLCRVVTMVDRFNRSLANTTSKLLLAMVLVTATVVVMRRGFDTGLISLQESITYMHGMLFLLSFAGCLVLDKHVRVDIFYRNLTAVRQSWVNLLGSIILGLPFVAYLIVVSTDYAFASWQVLEGSKESGGIPALFLLKTVVPLGFIALFTQITNEALYALSRIKGEQWPREVDEP